jgi:hypothetical protein
MGIHETERTSDYENITDAVTSEEQGGNTCSEANKTPTNYIIN